MMDPRNPIAFDPYSSDRGIDYEIEKQAREEAARLEKLNKEQTQGMIDVYESFFGINKPERPVVEVPIKGPGMAPTGGADALEQVLTQGIQNIKDPNVLRMAVEFAQNDPEAYANMRRRMNAREAVDPRIIEQAQRDLESGAIADRAAEATEDEMSKARDKVRRGYRTAERRFSIKQRQHREGRITDAEMQREQERWDRAKRQNIQDITILAGYLQPERRREMREKKLQRREDVTRQLAARSISRRIARGGDPNRLLTGYNTGGADRGRFLNPVEVGLLPARPPRAGEITNSPDGPRRTQAVNIPSADGGPDTQEMREVPVVETQFGEPIIDAGAMSREEFGQFYTRGDRQRISEQIYMSGGEMARRQRQIDAARTAMLDGFLTDDDRSQAEQDLTQKEQELHYEYARRQGGKRTVIRGGKKGSGSDRSAFTQRDLLDSINAIEGTKYESIAEAQRELGPRFNRIRNEATRRYREQQRLDEEIPLEEIPLAPENMQDMGARSTTPVQMRMFAEALRAGLLDPLYGSGPSMREKDPREQLSLLVRAAATTKDGVDGLARRIAGLITANEEFMEALELDVATVSNYVADLMIETERFVGGGR